MSEQIFLSRRNLLTLLSKLDRAAAGEVTACTVIKHRNESDPFVQTMDSIAVTAVEDDEFYANRNAGPMHPNDEVAIATQIYTERMKTLHADQVSHVYTGFEKGCEMRQAFGLDTFDGDSNGVVTVKFPESTYSVTSSFLRGLFEPSLRVSMSEADFLSRYRVEGPQIVRENFMSIVYRYFVLHK